LLFITALSKDALVEQNLKLREQNRVLFQALKSLSQSENAVGQGEKVRLVDMNTGEPIELGGDKVEGHLQVQTDNGWAYVVPSHSFGGEGAGFACKEMGYDIAASPNGSSDFNRVPYSAPVKNYVEVDCGGARNSISECTKTSARYGALKQKCTKLNRCPENANFATNDNLVQYWFEITARNGDEIATISTYDGEKKGNYFQGTKTIRTSSSCYVEIEFPNDNPSRDLYFKPIGALVRSRPDKYQPVGATITFKNRWNSWSKEWKCGRSGENYRCKDVRAGKFYWSGTYQITFNQASNPHWQGYGSYGN